MRSIKANLVRYQQKHQDLGSYICLAKSVKGRKYSRKALSIAFTNLVPKEDYDRKDRKSFLCHLDFLSNMVEEGRF